MDEQDIAPLAPHFTESPLFIIGVLVVIVLLAVVLRLVFSNTHKEYKHNPND